MAVAAEERVAAWCMAPTEYRIMAKRGVLQPIPSLHSLVAAGEALDPETLRMWREGTGVDVRDGYGQTETGQVTANPYGVPARPGRWDVRCPGSRRSSTPVSWWWARCGPRSARSRRRPDAPGGPRCATSRPAAVGPGAGVAQSR